MTTTSTPPAVGWQRLSPRMLLVHPVIELGKAVPAIGGALLAGGGSVRGSLWALGIAVVVTGFAMTRWFTTRYAFVGDQIQLRQGLLRRRSITARLERVRTVDVTSHPLHRVLGIARVVIGTGTSDRSGRDRLVLDGLGVREATQLRAELLHHAQVPPAGADMTIDAVAKHDAVPQPDETLATLDPRWIRYGPFTLTGAVAGLALLGVTWRVVSEGHVHLNRVGVLRSLGDRISRWSPVTAVLAGALAVIAFVVIASTIGYVLSFWRFTLARNPAGSLHVSRGLLTTRRTSIERRRLVGLELSEPLLLRTAGGARLLAVATGLRVGRGAERGGEVLLPPAPVRTATALAGEIMSEAGAAFDAPLVAHPSTALRRRLIRAVSAAVLGTAIVGAVVAISGLTRWLVVVAAMSLPLAVLLARDRYRNLGHALVGSVLVAQSGTIVRSRTVLSVDGIVGWTFRSSWFQRRLGLVTLVATTAAGRQHYAVHDLAADDSVGFADAVVPNLLTQVLAPPAQDLPPTP